MLGSKFNNNGQNFSAWITNDIHTNIIFMNILQRQFDITQNDMIFLGKVYYRTPLNQMPTVINYQKYDRNAKIPRMKQEYCVVTR